ncbi:MAG: metal-dependent hydrolase [Promethearchaeota archaeon]
MNSHFALGVIVASISHYFLNFCLFEFVMIVFSAFICDFDVFFSKYAKDNNHRNLITHSIIPSIIVIVLGIAFNWPALILSGFTLFLHIFVDLFDWGTNLFYFSKKTIGPRLFISNEEQKNLPEYLAQYKNKESFFDFKYYNNKLALIIEVLLFVMMIVCIIIYAFEYFLIVFIYFLGLCLHLSRHFHLKKLEKS